MGLDEFARREGCLLYFLTLTLKDDWLSSANRDVSEFFNVVRMAFKRAGAAFAYVWTVELQKRRYTKHGVKALHWHSVIACPIGALPAVERVGGRLRVITDGSIVTQKRLHELWGRGLTFSQPVRSPSTYAYIGKYITKEFGELQALHPEWAKLRRFGRSNLGWLAWPKWAREWMAEQVALNPGFAECYTRRVGRYAVVGVRDLEKYELFGDVGSFRVLAGKENPWKVVRDVAGRSASG
jgi:hypothetical protein